MGPFLKHSGNPLLPSWPAERDSSSFIFFPWIHSSASLPGLMVYSGLWLYLLFDWCLKTKYIEMLPVFAVTSNIIQSWCNEKCLLLFSRDSENWLTLPERDNTISKLTHSLWVRRAFQLHRGKQDVLDLHHHQQGDGKCDRELPPLYFWDMRHVMPKTVVSLFIAILSQPWTCCLGPACIWWVCLYEAALWSKFKASGTCCLHAHTNCRGCVFWWVTGTLKIHTASMSLSYMYCTI